MYLCAPEISALYCTKQTSDTETVCHVSTEVGIDDADANV